MGNIHQVRQELGALGIREGGTLFFCGNVQTQLFDPTTFAVAVSDLLGKSGTLVVPAWTAADEARTSNHDKPNAAPPEIANILLQMTEARVSYHPIFAFVASGANSEFLTANAPLHFPFGPKSVVARMHQLDALMLVLGGDYSGNPVIHLAEIWADTPYSGLSTTVADGNGNTLTIQGFPSCGAGFGRIENILKQARIPREGQMMGITCQLMRIRHVASMAGEMLAGDPGCLLCERPECAFCQHARTLTRKQGEPPARRNSDLEEQL